MTLKRLEQQSSASQTCGVGQKVPSNMEKMTEKMLAACGPMMAEMMQELSPREGGDECAPEAETAQPAQDVTRKTAGCGCGPMMARMLGECFKGGTSKAGEQD